MASPGRSGRTLKRLKPLAQDGPPFDPAPPKDYRGRWGGDLKDITWVRPELVIRAEIGGWTRDGQVRQTAYKGIEAGRDPKEVVKETAVATTTAVRDAEAAEPERPKAIEEAPMPSKSRSKPSKAPKSTIDIPEFAAPTKEELDELDGLGKEGVAGRRAGAEAHEPRQTPSTGVPARTANQSHPSPSAN